MKYSVILFYSTNYAMWAKDVLTGEEIENKMTSVPRHLSSNCGYCVRINTHDSSKAEKALVTDNIEFDTIESI